MEAKDLRICNLLNYLIIDEMDERKKWFEVSEIDYDDLRIIQNKHEINQDYQPIQLTKEWLLKFGFEQIKPNHYWFYSDNKLRFALIDNTLHCSIGDDECGFLYKMIKYVHQLQNLYWALTNQELTIQ
jgi:hypothetical protein